MNKQYYQMEVFERIRWEHAMLERDKYTLYECRFAGGPYKFRNGVMVKELQFATSLRMRPMDAHPPVMEILESASLSLSICRQDGHRCEICRTPVCEQHRHPLSDRWICGTHHKEAERDFLQQLEGVGYSNNPLPFIEPIPLVRRTTFKIQVITKLRKWLRRL